MATRVNKPRPNAKKPNAGLWTTIGIIAAVLFLLPLIVGLYTDFLWFGELDYRGVFNTVILSRVVLFVLFAAIGGAIAYIAAWLAGRGRAKVK